MKLRRNDDKNRGASLPTVLLASTLLLTLAFTVVGVSFNHVNMSTRLANTQHARNLAEAAVARGMERVMATDGNYGKNTGETIQVTFPDAPDPDAVGVLSFDAGDAVTSNVLRSTNNLETDASTTAADGTVIPANAVHLVGVGRCNGVERTVEALLYIPRFPYVIGSSGPIRSNGGLFVAGVKDKAALDAGFPIPEEDLIPGDLVTNASSGGDGAVNLTGTNQVKGDLQSSQGATLSADTLVEGEVRLYADPVEIPDLDISSYDPAGQPGLDDTVSPSYDAGNPPPTIDGFFKRIGNLDIYAGSGGLTLAGGLLYVDGNLEIYDGVHGKGAIVATGNVTIHGGGSASTDNMAAILADGDVTISGDANGNAMFEGLIYTEGDLDARFMTLAGTFVANNSSPVGDTMVFEDANLIHVPEYAEATVGGASGPQPSIGGSIPWDQVSLKEAITYGGSTLSAPANAALFPEMRNGSGTGVYQPPEPTPEQFEAELIDPTSFDPAEMNYYVDNPFNIPPPAYPGPTGYYRGVDDSYVGSSPNANTVDDSDLRFRVAGSGDSFVTVDQFPQAVADWLALQYEAQYARSLTPAERSWLSSNWTQRFQSRAVWGLPMHQTGFYSTVGPAAQAFVANPPSGGGGGGGGSVSYSIDLSDFFTVADSVRVLYWRESEAR